MNKVGDKAIRVACLQVRPGAEFHVVSRLKEACRERKSRHIILKGFGFYDIFLIYETEDFNFNLTMAGPIQHITNSNQYLCFPYLGCNASDFFDIWNAATLGGVSLIKLNPYSEKSIHDIENTILDFLKKKMINRKINHWHVLGTLGWHELFLFVSCANIKDIFETFLNLAYDGGPNTGFSDFLLKTSSTVVINHSQLPIPNNAPNNIASVQSHLEADPALRGVIGGDMTATISISSPPVYCENMKKFWREKGFAVLDSLGTYDIVVEPEETVTWAYFLASLLGFRNDFQSMVNSTYTTIRTKSKLDNVPHQHSVEKEEDSNMQINIPYEDIEESFDTMSPSLANHFYALNSALQNPITGQAFMDMKEYPDFLLKTGKTHQNGSCERTVEDLFLGATRVISQGASLRSCGIYGNQERVGGSYSKVSGGAQRALLAVELIPDHVFRRIKSKWYGFINIEEPKFSHFNDVIIVPTDTLWKPEKWWAIYHEIGHVIIDRTSWLEKDNSVVNDFLRDMSSPQSWHHFLVELAAEVLGFQLGFFSDFDLFLEVLWDHLIEIEPMQKGLTPLWPYLIRTFFVQLFEGCFRQRVISPENFQDEIWLHNELLKHVEKVEYIVRDRKTWPIEEKLLLAANHCQTLKKFFPFAKDLNQKIQDQEIEDGFSYSPPDHRQSRNIQDAFNCISSGEVWFSGIDYPESLLYLIIQSREKANFSTRIAEVLTFWNLGLERLKEK
jgi:hypothetical protein